MTSFRRLAAVACTALLLGAAPMPPTLPPADGFADLATLALAAPIVLRAKIIKAQRLSPRDAPGVAPGTARALFTAATVAAIVAPGDIPERVTYLADVALDVRGKFPKLAGADALLFVRGVDGRPGEFGLIAARGQIGWTAEADAALRTLLTAARRGDIPVVTGVASAFRVPGAVPGEAESQFFLATATGKPVSLVVLTRPGQVRQLTIALGDVIDEAAATIAPATLLWYRLACFLPATLPPAASSEAAVADDYQFVLAALGRCGRTF